MNKIYQELEILTITYKSDYIIEKCLSNIDGNFKVTIVENSDNQYFKKKIEKRKNTNCILTNSNLGFGSAFNVGANQIKSKYIFHLNPDVLINTNIIFKMYEMANEIDNLGILSPQETTNASKISNQITKKYIEVDHVKGFVMLINNFNCKNSKYFDENFVRPLTEAQLDESPSISPNGNVIVYATKDEGMGLLSGVTLSGAKFKLPAKKGAVREPAWSGFLR